LHHRFVIGPVAEIHFGNGIAFEDDEVGADAVEESAVVLDNKWINSLCQFILLAV